MAGQSGQADRPTLGYGITLAAGVIGVVAITGNPVTALLSVPTVMALAIGATSLVTKMHIVQVRRRMELLRVAPSRQNKTQVAVRLVQMPIEEILTHMLTVRGEFPIESVRSMLSQSELDLHDRVMRALDLVFPETPPNPS